MRTLFNRSLRVAVLMLRVYYLWSHSRLVQHLICVAFAICAGVALSFAGNAIHVRQFHFPYRRSTNLVRRLCTAHTVHVNTNGVLPLYFIFLLAFSTVIPGCFNVGNGLYWRRFHPNSSLLRTKLSSHPRKSQPSLLLSL